MDAVTFSPGVEVARPGVRRGSLIDNFANDGSVWRTSGTGTLTSGDTAKAADGMPTALKIVTGGTGSTFTVERDLFIDGRRKFFSFDLLADANAAGIDFGLIVAGNAYSTKSFARNNVVVSGTLSGTNTGYYFRPGVVHRVSLPVAMLSTNGSAPPTEADLADVRAVHFGFKDDAGAASTFYLSNFRVHDNVLPPGIVWVFDDARYDTLTTTYPILSAADFVGVVPVPTAQVGSTSGEVVGGLARMTWADLRTLQSAGWEHVSHTQNHTALTGLTTAQVQTEIRAARADLIANGINAAGADFLVYPGGQFDATALKVVASACRAARTVISTNNSANGNNYESPLPELERLRTLYFSNTGSKIPTSEATAVIDRLVSRGGQAIFTFHSIKATNSPYDADTYLTADFQTIVDYAVTKGMASYTFSDLWGR